MTREMALVIACCRWPGTPSRDAAINAIGPVDWNVVLRFGRRHRVQGLVAAALAQVDVEIPAEARRTLQAEARWVATSNLRLAGESVRLVRRLEEAGIAVLVLKGTSLAALAYGGLSEKMAWDIDLLVLPEDVGAAADVLERAGYACALPGPDRGALLPWHGYSKESVWRHVDGGIHVELHGAAVDSPHVLPGIDARSPAQRVPIAPGLALPTFETDTLFPYLCVHGAASGWRRAKWLADVGALIAPMSMAEVERLYHRSQQLGAGRAAGQALLLCHRYLAVEISAQLLASVRRDPWTRAMARAAGRMMSAADGFDDPAETRIGTLPIHIMQMMILPGWRFVADELRRKTRPDPRLPPTRGAFGLSARWVGTVVRRMRRA